MNNQGPLKIVKKLCKMSVSTVDTCFGQIKKEGLVTQKRNEKTRVM